MASPLAAAVSPPDGVNSVTSVSTSIDFVTGFTRKASMFSRSASSRTSSRPNAVTITTMGWARIPGSPLMRRAACSPSMPGIFQSMKTTS